MLGDPSVTRQRDVAVALRPSHRIFRVRQLHLPEIRLAEQSRSSSQRNQLRGWPVRWQRFPRVSARFLPWKAHTVVVHFLSNYITIAQRSNFDPRFNSDRNFKILIEKNLILLKSSYKYNFIINICQIFGNRIHILDS